MSFDVSEACEQMNARYGMDVPPRVISNMLYRRQLDARRCPIRNGRRSIPESYLPDIAAALRRLGYSAEAV